MLSYKGYSGHVEFDDKVGLSHGEVIKVRDVVTFQGKNVEESLRFASRRLNHPVVAA